MADENIQIINVQNSDGTKQHYSSLDGMRYINTNVGALSGGVDIALGASGLVLQTNTNDPPNKQNTLIYNNTFTNSVGDINAPSTLYTTDLMTIAKLDSTIPAVQIAPTSNTLSVIDTLNVSNGASNETVLQPIQITLNNGAVAPYMTIGGGNQFLIEGNGTNIEIKSNAQNIIMGDTQTSANGTTLVINDTHNNIDFTTINLCMYSETLALPICYTTTQQNQSFNYTNTNNWDVVGAWNMNLPTQFYSPNVNAVSQNWKIEFSINLRNCNPNGFYKENALYIEFRDTNAIAYNPFLYNQTTPWTRHSNPSTYNNTSADMLTYNWSDYVFLDMTTLQNASPLEVRLWWYSGNTNTADYDLVLSFTRTNIV